jgi:hypothetical protein
MKEDDVSIKRVSFTNGFEAELKVNGSRVVVRGTDNDGSLSVRMGDKIVLASCARTAHVPMSVGGVSLHTLFLEKYSTGGCLDNLDEALKEFSFAFEDVHWDNVTYLEAVPVVNAIRMLIPASSVA